LLFTVDLYFKHSHYSNGIACRRNFIWQTWFGKYCLCRFSNYFFQHSKNLGKTHKYFYSDNKFCMGFKKFSFARHMSKRRLS